MFIVTLPPQAQRDPAAFARRAKAAGADFLEIRSDLTPNVPAFSSSLPLVIAPRGAKALLHRFEVAFVDLDIDEELSVPSSVRIIRSFHDFERTPSLEELVRTALRLAKGCDVIKIATTIRSYADLATLEELHHALPRDQKRVILGMGIKAHLSRLLSPLKNAFTYTYLEEGEASAPGQLPLHLYSLTAHCRHPRIYGLLSGLNIQSLSPRIHNSLFALNDIDAVYALFPTEELDDAYDNLVHQGVDGFSVTSPFKQAILPQLDRLDDQALELRTANTVVREGAECIGYATDAYGLIEGYPFLKYARSAAILGSGGVVPSVIHACTLSGINDICVFARNEKTGKTLSSQFSVSYADIASISSCRPDVLINALSEDVQLALPLAKANAHAIDLRYGSETSFQTDARKAGYSVHDGLSMLLYQAIAQFRMFTSKEPSMESIKHIFSFLHHGKQ